MKNKIIAIALCAMLVMPTIAYAKGPNDKANGQSNKIETIADKNKDKDKDKNDNKGKNNDKKAQIEAFKSQLRAKHEIMKENTKKSVELRKQIEAKNEELSAILKDIEDGKKTLTQEQLDALAAQAAIVKEDGNALKAIKIVKSETKDTEEKVKGKMFEAALASLDKVIEKQQTRLTALTKLNSDLDVLLNIARQAQVVTDTQSNNTDSTNSTDSTSSTNTVEN